MLAIGRALMTSPRSLMIDEMSAGLAPTVAEALVAELVKIRQSGISLLLVEQNPDLYRGHHRSGVPVGARGDRRPWDAGRAGWARSHGPEVSRRARLVGRPCRRGTRASAPGRRHGNLRVRRRS